MLKLPPPQDDIAGLHSGCLKLCLRLVYIGFGSDTALEAVGSDAVRLLVILHGVVQQLLLGVCGAGLEVVDGEFSLKAEENCLAVACACLGLFASGANAATNASPDINLVVQVDRDLYVAETVATDTVRSAVGAV